MHGFVRRTFMKGTEPLPIYGTPQEACPTNFCRALPLSQSGGSHSNRFYNPMCRLRHSWGCIRGLWALWSQQPPWTAGLCQNGHPVPAPRPPTGLHMPGAPSMGRASLPRMDILMAPAG